MSMQIAYIELRTRYLNGWAYPITQFPNETFKKPEPSVTWARFHITDGDEEQLDIGSVVKSFRKRGILSIQLFAPLNTGSVDILAKADTLAAVFRNWCGATVTCRGASITNVGSDNFGWYQVNVSIPFHTDVLH